MTRAWLSFRFKRTFMGAWGLCSIVLFSYPAWALSSGQSLAGLYKETALIQTVERKIQQLAPDDGDPCSCHVLPILEGLMVLEQQRIGTQDQLKDLREKGQDLWGETMTQLRELARQDQSLISVGTESLVAVLVAASLDMVDEALKVQEVEKSVHVAAGSGVVKKGVTRLAKKAFEKPTLVVDLLSALNSRGISTAILAHLPSLAKINHVYTLTQKWVELLTENRKVQEEIWAMLLTHPACVQGDQAPLKGCRWTQLHEKTFLQGKEDVYFEGAEVKQRVMEQLEPTTLASVDYHNREQAYVCDLVDALYRMKQIHDITEDNLWTLTEGLKDHRASIMKIFHLMQKNQAPEDLYWESYGWGYVIGTLGLAVYGPPGTGTAIAVGEAISKVGDFLIKEGVSQELMAEVRKIKVFMDDILIYMDPWMKALDLLPKAQKTLMDKIKNDSILIEHCGYKEVQWQESSDVAGCWWSGQVNSSGGGGEFNAWDLMKDDIVYTAEIYPEHAGYALMTVSPRQDPDVKFLFSGYYDADLKVADFYLENPKDFLAYERRSFGLSGEELDERKALDDLKIMMGFDILLRLQWQEGNPNAGGVDQLEGSMVIFENSVLYTDIGGKRYAHYLPHEENFSDGLASWSRKVPLVISELQVTGAASGRPTSKIQEEQTYRLQAKVSDACPVGHDRIFVKLDHEERFDVLDRPLFIELRAREGSPNIFVSQEFQVHLDTPGGFVPDDRVVPFRLTTLSSSEQAYREWKIEFEYAPRANEDPMSGLQGMSDQIRGMEEMMAVPEWQDPAEQGQADDDRRKVFLVSNAVYPGRFLRVIEKRYPAFLEHWETILQTIGRAVREQREVVKRFCDDPPIDIFDCQNEQKTLDEYLNVHKEAKKAYGQLAIRFSSLPPDMVRWAQAPDSAEVTEQWRKKFMEDHQLLMSVYNVLLSQPSGEIWFRLDDVDALRDDIEWMTGFPF